MGFDTGYGGDQQDGGGSFLDDPSFLAQLQGAFSGGAPPDTYYGDIGPVQGGGPVSSGGGALFGPHPPPMPNSGSVSLPDGSTQPTSPFEAGGDSRGFQSDFYRGNAPTGGGRDGGGGMMGRWGRGGGGGWYGGYGNQGGGGQQQWYRPQGPQQQWYRPQGPQGSSRPDSSNPGAAYDAGPGRWEAQQQAQRDEQAQVQAQGPRQQGGPQRWGMPSGGAYGRPMQMRRRRFYGTGGGPMPPGAAASNLGGPSNVMPMQGGSPVGGGYNV